MNCNKQSNKRTINPKTMAKPWSVAIFEEKRSHLTGFARSKLIPLLEDEDCRRIVIRAPVKSGKREIAEYVAVRDLQTVIPDDNSSTHRKHAFLSAWHRKADESQRTELEKHNLAVFSIINDKSVEKFVVWLNRQLTSDPTLQIVLHLDECDHGSGIKQKLSKIWQTVRENPRITNILYSATPEEVRFSGEVEDEEYDDMMEEIMQGHRVEYSPPDGYCGPQKFLDEGLIFDAKPFFYQNPESGTYYLSEQARAIIRDFRESLIQDPRRNMIVLRLSYVMESGSKREKKENKAIYRFLQNITHFPELEDFLVVVDKGDKFEENERISPDDIKWSSQVYWNRQTPTTPTLIVIDQTSSRSTEWKCHDRIFVTHDFRNSLIFSVISQAQERTNHYAQGYNNTFQRIRIYGHKKTFMLSAGRIDYGAYLRHDWKKRKVDARRNPGPVALYHIQNTCDNTIHPEYPTPIIETEADRILQELGCYADVAVSQRVRGGVKKIQIIGCEFLVCDQNTFPQVAISKGFGHMQNPFVRSNTKMAKNPELVGGGQIGYLRTWKVYQYHEVEANKGWGFTASSVKHHSRATICYKDGVLGVGFRIPTGQMVETNTLNAYRSMYKTD